MAWPQLEVALAGFGSVLGLGDDDDAALGDMVALAVGLKVIADGGGGLDVIVLVDDGVTDAGPRANVRAVEDDGVMHLAAGVEEDVAAEHGVLHKAAGQDAARGHDRLHGLAAAAGFIEHALGFHVLSEVTP